MRSNKALKKLITFFVPVILISISFFVFYPKVKALDDPYPFQGYIYYSNGSAIPSGVTVTLTDQRNSNDMTTTTLDLGNGVTNFYSADVSQITDSQDGDVIVVSCSYNSQLGSSSSDIDLSEGGGRYVNVTMSTLPTIESPSPSNGSAGVSTTPTLSVIVNDTDGDTLDITWYSNSSGSWLPFGYNNSVSCNQTFSQINSNFSLEGETYWWNVSVSDGTNTVDSGVYHFTTGVADLTINVTPSSWNQGGVSIGGSNETSGFHYSLTNDGDVAVDVFVKASNATNLTAGAEWKLSNTASLDNFSLRYYKNGGSSWVNVTTSYDYGSPFVSSLAAGDSQTFDLKFIAATTSSYTDPMEFSITFKSVAS